MIEQEETGMTWHQEQVAELKKAGYETHDFRNSLVIETWDPEQPCETLAHHTPKQAANCPTCRLDVLGTLSVTTRFTPDAFRWKGPDLEIVEIVDTSDLPREKLVAYSDLADTHELPGGCSLRIIRRSRAGVIENRLIQQEVLEALWASLLAGEPVLL